MFGWGIIGQRQSGRVEDADFGTERFEKASGFQAEKATERPGTKRPVQYQNARPILCDAEVQMGDVGDGKRSRCDIGEIMQIRS